HAAAAVAQLHHVALLPGNLPGDGLSHALGGDLPQLGGLPGRDTASLGDDALPLSADLRLGLGDALAAQLLTDALLGLAAGGPLGGFPLLALADHVLHTGKVLVGPHRPPLAVRVVNAAELLDDGED